MHRIERSQLEVEIAVAIRTALGSCKPLLKPTRLPHESDELAERLAAAIVSVVDGESRAVVQTETYGYSAHGPRQGKWGIDEPAP